MSYSKVKYLIGGPGKLEYSYEDDYCYIKSYSWKGNGLSKAIIDFDYGKVSGKYQHGLK